MTEGGGAGRDPAEPLDSAVRPPHGLQGEAVYLSCTRVSQRHRGIKKEPAEVRPGLGLQEPASMAPLCVEPDLAAGPLGAAPAAPARAGRRGL